VLDGKYERISIVLRDVQGSVEGNAVSLPQLDVDARDVRASLGTIRSGQGEVVADTVNGTGTITYDSLAKLLDRPGLTLGEQDGRLAVNAPLDVLGQQLTVTGTADVTVNRDGAVALRFNDLNAEGLPNVPLADPAQQPPRASRSTSPCRAAVQLTVRESSPGGGAGNHADAKNVPSTPPAEAGAGGHRHPMVVGLSAAPGPARLPAHGDALQTARGRPVPRGHLPVSPRHLTTGLHSAA
jgi:hypothetical protein